MRHRKNKLHLGRKQGHRKMLLRELATSLFLYEKIETTEAKAKVLRPYAEKLITLGMTDTVASRRKAERLLVHKNAVRKLFDVLGPQYRERKGGYTSIMKTTERGGDAALCAIISLVK